MEREREEERRINAQFVDAQRLLLCGGSQILRTLVSDRANRERVIDNQTERAVDYPNVVATSLEGGGGEERCIPRKHGPSGDILFPLCRSLRRLSSQFDPHLTGGVVGAVGSCAPSTVRCPRPPHRGSTHINKPIERTHTWTPIPGVAPRPRQTTGGGGPPPRS